MEKMKETLVAWLRDAHAMEHKAIDSIENQLNRLENYPELEQRLQTHLEETRGQAERIKSCLDRYDEDTSTIKKGFGKFMGNAEALFNSAAGDEVIKNSLSSYALEHFEIASYTSLIAAAKKMGDTQTQQICEEILEQEKDMARWLENNLPNVTQTYLDREMAPEATAKH